MNRIQTFMLIGSCLLMLACKEKTNPYAVKNSTPELKNNGSTIVFTDTTGISFFQTEPVQSADMKGEIKAPAKVAATVLNSNSGAAHNMVLFDDPELSAEYSQYLQHQTNIKQIETTNITQRSTELKLTDELQQHGAATGRDLLDAQLALSIEKSNLDNEKAAIVEHATKLTAGGFNPEQLKQSSAGTVYIICDIPENEIEMIKEGNSCNVVFTSFPEQTFVGRINEIADRVDNTTRMLKVRIILNNVSGQFKAGMFATVSFGMDAGNHISVNENSIVTVEGKDYVFVDTGSNTFERTEVQTGAQIGKRVIIYSGLQDGSRVAVKGVMQLKGLSFGY